MPLPPVFIFKEIGEDGEYNSEDDESDGGEVEYWVHRFSF
jgi:hypothetical protein